MLGPFDIDHLEVISGDADVDELPDIEDILLLRRIDLSAVVDDLPQEETVELAPDYMVPIVQLLVHVDQPVFMVATTDAEFGLG